MNSAKIFWSGRSQAVRLPKDFRFDADFVAATREKPQQQKRSALGKLFK